MKKLIIAFILAVAPGLVIAAGGGAHLDHANIDLHDKASLQRGAKLFVNYCLNCHSANYMRYNRMGEDLGIPDNLVKENLLFAADKVGEQMKVAMSVADGKNWFGTNPPDLTVIARAKGAGSQGADWLYTYLRSFYVDESRPFGVNNTVFKDVGMPHVLWELQGLQALNNVEEVKEHGAKPEFILAEPGSMSPDEYDSAMRDLVNFLVYMGEPSKLKRQSLGIWVLLFLVVFTLVAYALKKEYWKDIH
ncbi:MAG: cytochrome c1 [Granulosicoccaceae bacterium]|jgi:ubiquinol-cytochrome c reductase cytochrome c1 subunit